MVDSIEAATIPGDLKPGIDMHSSNIVHVSENNNNNKNEEEGDSVANSNSTDVIFYSLEENGQPPKSGVDINESILAAWKACEIISIEDSHFKNDKQALRNLKEVLINYNLR